MARGVVGSASTAACHAPSAMRAASGSQWTFHSATGVVLPGTRKAPPIAIQRPSSRGRAGSISTAMARLVRGPSVTSVSSPGRRRASSTISCGAKRADTGIDGSGGSANPRPRGPCVSGVISRGRSSPAGRLQDGAAVALRVRGRGVAGQARDRDQLRLRAGAGVQQRQGVVDPRVDVEDERCRHPVIVPSTARAARPSGSAPDEAIASWKSRSTSIGTSAGSSSS